MAYCTSIRTLPELRAGPPQVPWLAPRLLTCSCNSHSGKVPGEGTEPGATELSVAPALFLASIRTMTRIGSRVTIYGSATKCFAIGREDGGQKWAQRHQNKRQEADEPLGRVGVSIAMIIITVGLLEPHSARGEGQTRCG